MCLLELRLAVQMNRESCTTCMSSSLLTVWQVQPQQSTRGSLSSLLMYTKVRRVRNLVQSNSRDGGGAHTLDNQLQQALSMASSEAKRVLHASRASTWLQRGFVQLGKRDKTASAHQVVIRLPIEAPHSPGHHSSNGQGNPHACE